MGSRKKSIRADYATWRWRVLEMAALIRDGRAPDAYSLAPSVFRFCFPMLARLYTDAQAEPTEADFLEYQCYIRRLPEKSERRAPRPANGQRTKSDEKAPTAFAPFKELLKLKEKPPGMTDARWRMIQTFKKNPDRYEARGF